MSTPADHVRRVPAGIPTGGQFAAHERGESTAVLDPVALAEEALPQVAAEVRALRAENDRLRAENERLARVASEGMSLAERMTILKALDGAPVTPERIALTRQISPFTPGAKVSGYIHGHGYWRGEVESVNAETTVVYVRMTDADSPEAMAWAAQDGGIVGSYPADLTYEQPPSTGVERREQTIRDVEDVMLRVGVGVPHTHEQELLRDRLVSTNHAWREGHMSDEEYATDLRRIAAQEMGIAHIATRDAAGPGPQQSLVDAGFVAETETLLGIANQVRLQSRLG